MEWCTAECAAKLQNISEPEGSQYDIANSFGHASGQKSFENARRYEARLVVVRWLLETTSLAHVRRDLQYLPIANQALVLLADA